MPIKKTTETKKKSATTKKVASSKSTAKKTSTKTTARKTTASKTAGKSKTGTRKTATSRSSKKTARKQTAAEKKLVKKLSAMLPELDAEGLQFLIEQAEVHLYNMRVVALQEEMQKNAASIKKPKAKKADEGFSVVRGEDGHVYHIVHDGKYTMFNDEEMLSIIKIAKSASTISEKIRSMYHWFFIERRDFINAHGLGSIDNPLWENLINLIKKNFRIS